MPRIARHPEHVTTLKTYDELERLARAFASGHLNLLILLGAPGLGKSQILRHHLDDDVLWMDCHVTPFELYRSLYHQPDALVVLDDVDGLVRDAKAVRLLKALCQTDPVKRVGWHSATSQLEREGIPTQYTTTCRLAVVGNDWATLNANVAALEDRGHVIVFQPAPLEVHTQTARWFWDQEVFDFIAEHLHLCADLSMRTYKLAWEQKQGGLDWRRYVLSALTLHSLTRLVAELRADPSFTTEQARVNAFLQQTGKSRGTYYNHLKRLEVPSTPVPSIRLVHALPGTKASRSVPPWFDRMWDGQIGFDN